MVTGIVSGFIPVKTRSNPVNQNYFSDYQEHGGVFWDKSTYKNNHQRLKSDTKIIIGNKDYNSWLEFDYSNASFHISNDVLGLSTIYYLIKDDIFYFSTDCNELAKKVSSEINWKHIGNIWYLINPLGNDTPYQDIKKLSPGSSLKIHDGTVSIKESPYIPKSTGSSTSDFNDWADVIKSSLKRVTSHGTISLGLSGGLDSRVILAFLMSGDRHFMTHVFGQESSADVRISRQITRSENIDQNYFNIRFPDIDTLINDMFHHSRSTFATRPASDVLNLYMFDELAGDNYILVDGGFGEIGRRHFLNRLLYLGRHAMYTNDIEKITRLLTHPKPSIFSADTDNVLKSGLMDIVGQEWTKISNLGFTAGTTLDLLALRNRVPNFGGPIQSVLDSKIENVMPLILPEVLDVLFSIPESKKRNSRLYKKAISKYAGSLENYELAKGSSAVPYKYGFWRSRLYQKMKNRSSGDENKTRIDFLHHLKPWLQDYINSKTVTESGVYDHARLKTCVESFYNGDHKNALWIDFWLAFEGFRKR